MLQSSRARVYDGEIPTWGHVNREQISCEGRFRDRDRWFNRAVLGRDPDGHTIEIERSSKDTPRNTGIIRNALTTTLALELEYREPSIVREIGAESKPPQSLNTQSNCLKMSLHAS